MQTQIMVHKCPSLQTNGTDQNQTKDPTSQNEMIILEFQGSFEHNQYESDEFGDLDLGTLQPAKFGANMFELLVGNQIMKGKKSKLAKPMLMTERVRNVQTNQVEMVIKAVIREKIEFQTRPTPLKTS